MGDSSTRPRQETAPQECPPHAWSRVERGYRPVAVCERCSEEADPLSWPAYAIATYGQPISLAEAGRRSAESDPVAQQIRRRREERRTGRAREAS